MIWGKIEFPAPEAALHACRVVKDNRLRDAITQAMTENHQQRTNGIKHDIKEMRRNHGS